jgi:hypothetical protein
MVSKSNMKIVGVQTDTPNTHIHDRSFFIIACGDDKTDVEKIKDNANRG